ncbi:MAG: carbohydrate ABC transporter permease [Desulfobacterales bacterium]|nr:MAG: carbohydrate ABC transporter permease [Desulfobacterales bacterium]
MQDFRSSSAKRHPAEIALISIAGIIVFLEVAPFLWMVMMSFKSRLDIFEIPPKFIFKPIIANYYNAFVEGPFSKYLLNSLIIDSSSTLLAIAIGTLAAYAFSRFTIFGAKHIFFFILTTRMCPPVVVALPLFIMYSKLGLYDTRLGVILVHTIFNLALVVWLMRGFFDEIPKEIDQAAMIDGHSDWTVFRKFVLPLALPGIVVSAMFCLVFSWNEFLFALILTQFDASTLPVGIPQLVTSRGTYWGQVAAVGVVITLPVLFFALVFHKYLVRGLTFGAVKT